MKTGAKKPAIAQVLRIVGETLCRIVPSPVGYDFGPAHKYLAEQIAALEAPEREAGREVVAEWLPIKDAPKDRRLECLDNREGCISVCDWSDQENCWWDLHADQPAHPTHYRFHNPPREQMIYQTEAIPPPATPTETPPPAWDAEKFVADRWGVSSRMVCDFGHIVDLAQAAYTEGQRAALELPEEMPAWFPKFMARHATHLDDFLWSELCTHLNPAKGAER